MMDTKCADFRALLDAECDGELDAASVLRLETHTAGCAVCAAERAGIKDLRAAIAQHATRHTAPAALRDAVFPQDAVPVPMRRAGRWPAAGAGFGVGAALAAGIAVMIGQGAARDRDADGVVAAHIRALQPGHLTDVQVTDQHIVKPWFDGKVDFAPPVKDLTEQGFALVGGRLDYIDGRNAAVVVYRRRLHLIDLFVAPANGLRQAAMTTPSGYNVERWSVTGQEYWAVSDLNPEELAEFAKLWRAK